jgi:putative transposase
VPDDEPRLLKRIVDLATDYGRYGYRRVTALLHREGWKVNHKRVEHLRSQEGLKIPKRQPKRRRLWMNDGSCIRLRPQRRDHVWSYDFPDCGGAMKIISFIERRQTDVIQRILRHCGLWQGFLRTHASPRAPPNAASPKPSSSKSKSPRRSWRHRASYS